MSSKASAQPIDQSNLKPFIGSIVLFAQLIGKISSCIFDHFPRVKIPFLDNLIIYNYLNQILRMVVNRNKTKPLIQSDQPSDEERITKLKASFFEITYAHLRLNEQASPYPYYTLLLLEHLSLLWFVLHPNLNIFGTVYLLPQLQMVLQIINFYEYMTIDNGIYVTMVLAVFFYLLLQIALLLLSIKAINDNHQGTGYQYLHKLVNYQLIINVKVLCGPMLGLVANVLYCTSNSPYHANQICYTPIHLIMCILSVLLLLIVLAQVALFSFIYYVRNPLTSSYLGQQTRFFLLSKTLIKILLPVYFALDFKTSLSLVYIFVLALLWGGYLFFHRLLSTHTYEQQHFYIEFFMESFITWLALNNVLSYYIQGPIDQSRTAFLYAVLSALLGALLLVNFERTLENKFIEECLEEQRMKKQNMERFIYILIHKFIHLPDVDAQLNFRVYSKLLENHITAKEIVEHRQWSEKEEIYYFLCQLVEEYIRENSSILLKTLKCHLLCLLGQKSYGLHQSLELLEESRIGLIDEFMLFQFRKSHDLCGDELNGKVGSDFVRFYRFHERLGQLEQLQQQCALNNLEYWEELAETGPSLVKLHNLATHYSLFMERINQQFAKVIEVFPQNINATTLQLNFLMNVAVDVRETLRLKQKLKSVMDNHANSLRSDEMGEDENVSIVTADTIGSNLGVILNCNNHLKGLLGFERQAIIGKNLTKLMPKIYIELHNQFMLSFIRSESSHLRPSNKRVTALNHMSLLVEINLTVRIMTSSEDTLVIVGFMRRIPSQAHKGLVMFEGNTGQVLGVDEYFLSLVKGKLTGKQVISEQLRINALMPEANLETLEQVGYQNTILEVGSHRDQDGTKEERTRKVLLQLRESKLYDGKKLCFVTVGKDESNFRSQGKKRTKEKTLMKRYSVLQQPIEIKSDFNTSQQESSQRDLNFEKITRGDKGLRNELPTVRRYEEYIKSKEESSNNLLIKAIYMICLLGCAVLAMIIFFSHNSYLANMDDLYGQMRNVSDLSYYEAQINLYSENVWDIDKINYGIDYTKYLPQLGIFINKFEDTLYALITDTQNYPHDLQYNTRNLHNFTFSTANGTSIVTNHATLVTIDGIAIYISAASALLDPNFFNFTFQNQLKMQREALYIRYNGQTTIPAISQNSMNDYSIYIGLVTSSELNRMIILKGLLLSIFVFCLLLIAFLGNYINKTNKQVTDIYQQVRLWDVEELVSKCNKFLQIKGLQRTRKRRSNTSLIKMLPIQGLIDLIKMKNSKEGTDNKKASSKNLVEPSMQSENFYSQNQTPAHLLSPAEPEILDKEETCLQEAKQSEGYPTVHLECQFSNKPIIIAITIILLLVVAMLSGECIMVYKGQNELIGQISRLLSIGHTRKTLNFMNYFAYRVIHNPKDSTARSLLVDQINLFYSYTVESYRYLGDPNDVLKQVYSIVETLQQGFALPNISSAGLLVSSYSLINQTLQTGSDAIASLDATTFHPQYQSSLQSCIQVLLIFTLSFLGLVLVVVVSLHWYYVQPIQSQCSHSINMLKLLPAWVLDRSKKGVSLLSQ